MHETEMNSCYTQRVCVNKLRNPIEINRHTEYLSDDSKAVVKAYRELRAGELNTKCVFIVKTGKKENVNNAHKRYNLTLSLCSKKWEENVKRISYKVDRKNNTVTTSYCEFLFKLCTHTSEWREREKKMRKKLENYY